MFTDPNGFGALGGPLPAARTNQMVALFRRRLRFWQIPS